MPAKIDLTGKIYGIIQVDSAAPSQSGKTYWNCHCIICGKQKIIQGCSLKNGAIKTCGCGCSFHKEEAKQGKIKRCEICGKEFIPVKFGGTRKYCYECSPQEGTGTDKRTIIRRALKKMLVDYKGGVCERCGYNKCLRALEFHHLDPSKKDFGISGCITKNVEQLKQEVDKCILVCSNCHAEIHEELDKAR